MAYNGGRHIGITETATIYSVFDGNGIKARAGAQDQGRGAPLQANRNSHPCWIQIVNSNKQTFSYKII